MSPLLVGVAAVRSFAAYLTVSLCILLAGPPVLLWTLLSRRPALLYWAGALVIRIGLALAGIRFDVEGAAHILRGQAAVYVINHTSNVEPPVVFCALRSLFPQLRVLYKAELRKIPVLVWVFDAAGFVPLERDNRDQSRPAVDRAVTALAEGASFLIFPEGTRSRTGALLPFKKGGFVMAIRAQAPLVPIAISGARQAMRKGSPIIRPVRITLRIAPPVPTAGLTFDDRDAVVAEVRAAIGERLEA